MCNRSKPPSVVFVGAFAVILGDGSLVTWGAAAGGDSSGVGDQLKHVQQIQASAGAFCCHAS